MYGTDVITVIVRHIKTHKYFAWTGPTDKFQKCFAEAKHFQKCFELPKHFQKCFQTVGPVCWIHFWRETIQCYIQKSFLIIRDFKKIWNRDKIFFLVRPQYCPPFFSPIQCLPGTPQKKIVIRLCIIRAYVHIHTCWLQFGITMSKVAGTNTLPAKEIVKI